MIILSSDGIEVSNDDGLVKSEGAYGYVVLGLSYHFDDKEKILRLTDLILVRVDIKLKCCIEVSLYEDMFEHPVEDIYEENGNYYCEGLPVINYSMLNIPEILTGIKEKRDAIHGFSRRLYNQEGDLQYSVNPICSRYSSTFYNDYTELYSCVLSFDEETHAGTGVGFDTLGKIKVINCSLNIDDLYETLIKKEDAMSYYKPGEEGYERALEFGFLNLSFKVDGQGNKLYNYDSIWNQEVKE